MKRRMRNQMLSPPLVSNGFNPARETLFNPSHLPPSQLPQHPPTPPGRLAGPTTAQKKKGEKYHGCIYFNVMQK